MYYKWYICGTFITHNQEMKKFEIVSPIDENNNSFIEGMQKLLNKNQVYCKQ